MQVKEVYTVHAELYLDIGSLTNIYCKGFLYTAWRAQLNFKANFQQQPKGYPYQLKQNLVIQHVIVYQLTSAIESCLSGGAVYVLFCCALLTFKNNILIVQWMNL